MALSFPNQSRNFDGSRISVRFWGYDGALEISIFIDSDALQALVPTANKTEAGLIAAFDQAREKICAVADRVYSRSPKGTFVIELHAKDM